MNISKGYNFPESSDIEDEEDYDFSDMEMDEKNTSMSDDGVSVEGSQFKAMHSSLEPIDLTRDDSPENSNVGGIYSQADQVNLVTPPPPGRHLTGQPPLGHFQVPVATANRNEPIILETDEEDGGFSTDSDDRSELGQSESNESLRDDPCADNYEDSDDNSDLIDMNDEPIITSPPDAEKNHIRSIIQNNEVSEDEDSDSDLCLSEAGREGIRALFDDGLLGKDDDNFDMKSTDFSYLSANARTLQRVGISPIERSLPVKISLDHFLEHREPSPSDAAMVKPAAISRLSVNAMTVDHIPSKEWFETTSQSLGDKTGKHAFFEARTYNKAKVNQGGVDDSTEQQSCLSPVFNESTGAAVSESAYHEPKPVRIIATPRGSWARRSRTPRDTPDLTLSPSVARLATIAPIPYLDNHAQAPPLMERDPSSEPDLTSAVKFYESKIRLDAANRATENISGRSRLSINDIIDGSFTDSARGSQTYKRKADDISSADADTKDCVSTSASLDRLSTDSRAENLLVNATLKQPHHLSEPATSAALDELETIRPAKRLKKFAQRLSYAALGGAAVGGALLSVLVATAPDYL